MYAGDYKQTIPVARQDLPDNGSGAAVTQNVWWTDQVGPYVTQAVMNSSQDLSDAQRSVMWGCPEWEGRSAGGVVSVYDPGYGMNAQLSTRPDYPAAGAATPKTEFAMRWLPTTYPGTYYRAGSIRYATDRVLVADAMLWHLNARPVTGGVNNLPGQYLDPNQVNASSSSMAGLMDYDLYRHAGKPKGTVDKGGFAFFEQKPGNKVAVNAVFHDGHAETMSSIEQAYRGIFLRAP